MTTVTKTRVRLHIPEVFPAKDDMADKWARGQTTNAALINQRRKDKIPDAAIFNQRVAIPASIRYAAYVPDGFISRGERNATSIRNAHYKNLMTGYNHWNNKLELAFETVDGIEAKRFKEQVANSKDIWAWRITTKTLRFTGDKIRGRGAAPIACFWLTDDSIASGLIREGQDEVLGGGPYNIAIAGGRTALRVALNQRLIQAGVLIVNSDFNPDVILKQNTITAELLSGLRDPARADAFAATPAPDKSYCAFVKEKDGPFYLEIQVVLTTP